MRFLAMHRPSKYFLRICALLMLPAISTPRPWSLAEEAKRDVRGRGTRRMAERLQTIADQVNPIENLFLSKERVRILQGVVAATTDTKQRELQTFHLASELLNAGL